MSGKNKNYNSIIFLTTLSVYLGLSLLGATPQVLAYAATTRNFDIQTEIEFKDDLDNKPDKDEVDEDFPLLKFEEAYKDFFVELKNLKKQKKFKLGKKLSISCSHKYCVADCGTDCVGPSTTIDLTDSSISDLLSKLHSKFEELLNRKENFSKFTDIVKGKDCVEITNNLSFNKKFFNHEISFSKNSENEASLFSEKLNNEFKKKSDQTEDSILKEVLKNSRVVSNKEFVLVITHLPRAAIDSLII